MTSEHHPQPRDWTNPTPHNPYDLVIIGAGPAGLAAAEFAIDLGLKLALVERNRLGGNSLNAGSVPSKAIVHAARAFAARRAVAEYSKTDLADAQLDYDAVMTHMRRTRLRIAKYHSLDRLLALGVEVFFGDARFCGPRAVIVGENRLNFNKALIATGARPRPSNIPGLDAVEHYTSDTIFEAKTLPKRLVVIGGGPLGCELAQAYCRLGSQVTIVQNDPKFLPREERDAAEILSRSMARDGVQIRLNTTVVGAHMRDGIKCVDTVSNDAKDRLETDEILLSIGRVPNTEGLDLHIAGVDCNDAHAIVTDDFLCTTNGNIYAAGDVCLTDRFTHVAQATARMAVQNAMSGTESRQSKLTIPWCTFCDPEIAHVGFHCWEARADSVPVKTYTVLMQDVDRAIIDGEDTGFVKIHVRAGTDTILGATIIATHASEMINEISVIIGAGLGMRALSRVLHTYPTQSEAVRLAASAYMREQSR